MDYIVTKIIWTKSFKPAHEKEFCYLISTPEKERKRERERERKG